MQNLESGSCEFVFFRSRNINTRVSSLAASSWEKLHDVGDIRVDIDCAPWELDPQPSLVVIMSGLVFVIHRDHLMFPSCCLGRNFFPNHLDDLFSDDFIVKIEAFQAGNQLARVHNHMLWDLFGLLLPIVLEQVLEFFYLLEKSNGIYFSCSEKRWVSELWLLSLSPWN